VVETFLDVASSVTGRRWRGRPSDDRLAMALCRERDLPEIVGRILAGRGVTLATAETFLTPTLRALLPDPGCLQDMEKAAARIAGAVQAGEPVGILGDYDVDGATASALLIRFLRWLGVRTHLHIPDRITEGYGPNAAALEALGRAGCRLILCVDCGTVSFEAIGAATKLGLDILVLDHHTAEPALPPAYAVVNPNRLDDRSGLGTLCAAGVAFLTLVAVNRALRQAGWYATRAEPPLLSWLDLVAVGTICDVVPLVGLNRALAAQGLKVLARRSNPGFAALADLAGLKERPNAYHTGFMIGPRLNAGGRVGGADIGARLLATDDAAEAAVLAQQLDAHNTERRTIENAVLAAALRQVGEEENALTAAGGAGPILVGGQDWHPGVVGIVASRLTNRFHRPACVVSFAETGVGKGSGRSIAGFNLGAAIIAARQAGLLLGGGGHPMAAGFTVAPDGLPALADFLGERFAAETRVTTPISELELDGALAVSGATPDLLASLEQVAPFGAGNPEPRFALPGVRIVRADPVGQNHVRCIISGPAGVGRLKAIAFRALESPLGEALLQANGTPIHLAGTLRPDTWQGRTDVQLFIDDAAKAG